MDKGKLGRALAVFLSGYAKRFMEDYYDRAMKSPLGKRLMELSQIQRYGIEVALYAAMAYGDYKIPENSPWQKLLKDVLLDAPPEISKRLVNGFRDEYVRNSESRDMDIDRRISSVLADLDPPQLAALLQWASTLNDEEIGRFRVVIRQLTKQQLHTLASLTPDERKLFLVVTEEGKARPTGEEKPKRSPALQAQIDEARQRVREQHRQLRERKATK